MGLDAAVAVGVGVSVGAIYGVTVGVVAPAPPTGDVVWVAGSAGLVQASTADATATRATIAATMATVIGLLLEAILGCASREFMTRKYYTTREHGDGGCRDAKLAVASMTTSDVVDPEKSPVNEVHSLGR